MARRLSDFTDDQLWQQWREDIERIRKDAHQLFGARRTFREVVQVFSNNRRLQQVGGHLWEWMRVNYVSFVLMWIRREIDTQTNTVNLNQLLNEMEQRPSVINRGRRRRAFPVDSELLAEMLDADFTNNWVRARQPNSADDAVDVGIVSGHRNALREAAEHVEIVANQTVAHRVRVTLATLTVPQVDAVLEVVETTLTKYYALLQGSSLVGLEPTPQFDTLEAFTFPWLERTPWRQSPSN